jgi:fructokinase
MGERELYGAIEAGGTKIVCAAGYDAQHAPEAYRAVIPTAAPQATLAAVAAFFAGVEREAGPFAAIGVAGFGPLDVVHGSPTWGSLLATPKPGWSGVSLVEPLRRFNCPIALDTDVNAAALAEARLGAGRGVRTLAYVTVGTGIGGGAVIGARSVSGFLHPEMGHIRVRRDPRDAGFAGVCPFHGDCLEGLASGPAVLARWASPMSALPPEHPGHALIGGYLGELAAVIALMLSSERIVFGGGVMSDGSLLVHIRATARRTLAGYLPIEARAGGFDRLISRADLGERAGIVGAFLLAQERYAASRQAAPVLAGLPRPS